MFGVFNVIWRSDLVLGHIMVPPINVGYNTGLTFPTSEGPGCRATEQGRLSGNWNPRTYFKLLKRLSFSALVWVLSRLLLRGLCRILSRVLLSVSVCGSVGSVWKSGGK